MNIQDKNLILQRYVIDKEEELVDSYIVDGPTALKIQLSVSEDEWQVIFDQLVFEHDLLFLCVKDCADFFVDAYVKHGISHVREILGALDEKYDVVWEKVFDVVVSSRDGLYYHVLEHRDRYLVALKARGADFVRKVLGISALRYDHLWEKALDILLNAECKALFSDRTLEVGLKAFSMLINGMRKHRSLGQKQKEWMFK